MMISIRGGKALFGLLCLFALNPCISSAIGDSDAPENPYSAIWQRNSFDLTPANGAADETREDTSAPPNVQLTGITTILGRKQALFIKQVPQVPGKPGTGQLSCILAEGERKSGLEVLEINLKTAKVKIKNEGIISTLTLQTNKPATLTTTAPRNTPIQGVPRATRSAPPQNLNEGYTPSFEPPVTASPSQGAYAPPAYSSGFAAGYIPPAQTPNSSPAPTPANTPEANPDSQNTSPTPLENHPGVTPEIAALLTAAEEAARQGSLTPPALPAYAAPTTGYTMQNGRLTPPPPNFPTPPPLPANFGSLSLGK